MPLTMAGLQPEVGGQPTPPPLRSFKEALVTPVNITTSLMDIPHFAPTTTAEAIAPHRLGSHKGTPAIFFSRSHITTIAQKFSWALIGKFSKGYNKINPKIGRPSVEDLVKYFQALDLKQEVQLGLLDNRHVLIQIAHHDDFLRLYSRPVWYVRGIPMRMFKWSESFHVDRESPLVPVWVGFPRLPVHYFEYSTLMAIASLLGTPLRLDSSTTNLKRPSIARVQIEIDLLKPRLEKIWIGVEGGDGFWQNLDYEEIPDYCQHCFHVGHSEKLCTVHNSELTIPDVRTEKPPDKKQTTVYVPKVRFEPIVSAPETSHEQDLGTFNKDSVQQEKIAEVAANHPENPVMSVPTVPPLTVSNDDDIITTVPNFESRPTDISDPPVETDGVATVILSTSTDISDPPVEEEVPLVCTSPATNANKGQPAVSSQATKASHALDVQVPLNPYAAAFHISQNQCTITPLQDGKTVSPKLSLVPWVGQVASSSSQVLMPFSHDPLLINLEMGYNDSDNYEDFHTSEGVEDDEDEEKWSTTYDFSDGSVDKLIQKRQGRRKLKTSTPIQLETKKDFTEQSRMLSNRIQKRGRPPGSRNRTYFDVVRTMNTRKSKSKSN